MPRNLFFAAKRGKVDFKACPEHLPAVGAETLEDGVVRRDVPTDLLGRLGAELGIEGERYVDDAAARGADDMRMRLDLAHGVKNQLSLPGIPSLHRHAPRLFSINGRR